MRRKAMSTRNLLILCFTPILVALLAGGSYLYYHKVYVPAHEDEWRQEARAKWLQIVASRNGQKLNVQGQFYDGDDADWRILLKCFKIGEPAANYEAILATASDKDEENEVGRITYRWYFHVPKPPHPDGTVFFFFATVSGNPPVIDLVGGSYASD